MMRRSFVGHRASSAPDDAMQVEQAKLLYASLPAAIIINTVLALTLVSVQSAVISSGRLFGWLAMLAAVLFARGALAVAWHRSGQDAANYAVRWIRYFRISVIATGIAWGMSAVLLFPAGDVTHQVFLAFALAGLSAGAISLLAVDQMSTLGFLVPVLAPLIARFWMEGGEISLVMSVMVALFLFFIASNAALGRRSLHENFRLRISALEQGQVLRLSEARLNQAQRIAKIGNWDLDLVSNKLHWSDEIYRIFEIDQSTFGASYEAFLNAIHPDDREMVDKAYADSLANRTPYEIAHRLLFADGRIKFVNERCETIFDAEGKAIRSLGTVQDITERKKDEELIRNLAFYDALTQLPNRRLLNDRLRQTLVANKRSGHYAALMFLDLDNFKTLNDTQGHDVGDLLLIEVAHRISSCIREMDTIARFGGDEFVVILSELDADKAESFSRASIVAEKIRVALAEPYVLTLQQEDGAKTVEHHCTSSIGVVLFIDHEISAEEILKQADVAMYKAKAGGRNQVYLV